MSLLEFPNPVGWFEAARNAGMQREEVNALVSALYSAQITFLWESGKRSWWGEGKAIQRAAVAQYLTLTRLESKNFLTLTVPKDMLDADLLAQFETEAVKK